MGGYVRSPDGASLYYEEWMPRDTGVVSAALFIHGIGLCCNSKPYGEKIPVKKLVDRGVLFYAVDLRGHGRTAGNVDSVSSDTFLKDIDAHIKDIRERHGKIPVYLYGHNFGGMLALKYLSERQGSASGAIVSEYSMRLNRQTESIRVPGLIDNIYEAFNELIHPGSKRFELLTRMEYQRLCSLYHKKPDEALLDSLEPDGGVEVRSYGSQFFKACGVGKERSIAKKVRAPVLMIFSRDDAFFDVKGAYDVLTELKSDKKEIVIIDKAGHYSVVEKSHDIIYRWLNPLLPKP